MTKRILSLLLSLVMVLSMVVFPANAVEATAPEETAPEPASQGPGDYCQHCKQEIPADQWIPWSVTDTGPRTGHYYLSEDITSQTSQITINLDDDLLRNVICLDLRGHTYTVTGIRPFLIYGVFSIMDSVGGGEIAVTGHKSNANGAFAQVSKKSGCKDGAGEVNVYSGTLRRINDDRYVVAYGGLIYLASGTTLNLHGGKLIGGEARARFNSSGTPISGMGGTVFATSANVNIYGGTLTGGSAPDTTLTLSDGTTKAYDGSGGNIYAEKSSRVTISGGVVENGYCGTNVGNIYLKESHFVMTGGIVRGGYCEGAAGNVGFTGANSSFKMSGGVIRDGVCVTRGGNLFVNNSTTTVEITGGEIYGDISAGSYKSFVLSGAPKIYMGKGNGLRLQTNNTNKMDVSGLTEGAVIYLDGVDQVFTKPLTDAQSYLGYFKDAVRADISVDETGALKVAQGTTGYCPHCWEQGTEATWTAWHNNSSTSTSVINETADVHYYLTASCSRKGVVSIGTSSVRKNDVVFDMAGKTMTNERTKLFNLYANLSLMDSIGSGYMTGYGADGANGGVIMASSPSTFNMYSGTLRRVVNEDTESRKVYRGGVLFGHTVNIYGGTVMGGLVNVPLHSNSPKNPAGGNIYAANAFTMTAGAIRDGEARAHTGYYNSSTGAYAGTSVYSGNGGNVYLASTGNISGGYIQGGNATYGAGIFVYSTGSLTVTGGVIENGTCNDPGATSNYGGNIYVAGTAATDTAEAVIVDVQLSNALIRGGTAKRQGGNIYAGFAHLTIRDCVIADGQAGIESSDDGRGGNLYLSGSASCDLYSTTIGSGNALGHGGNIYGPGGVELRMHSGLITGGTAVNYGGNMYCNGLTMHSGRITSGTSGSNGGNIYVYTGEENYLRIEATADAPAPVIAHGTAGHLGGNIAMGKNTTATITGAIIENGTGDTGNKSSFNGDNLYGTEGAHMTLTDTVIRGFSPSSICGNGVYAGGELVLKGNTTVTNEEKDSCIYIASTGKLTVDASFSGISSAAFEYAHFADAKEPQGGTLAEQNSATGVFTGELLLEGYNGNEYGLPAIFAQTGDDKLYIASTAVVDPVNDTVVWYKDSTEAAANVSGSSYLKLYKSENAIALTKDTVVDLNGNNLTATGTGTLYGFDSSNDDYEGFGIVTTDVPVADTFTAPNGKRYVTLTEETGISFHRLGMQVAGMTLRPSVAGMYFTGKWECDAVMASRITSYGIAVSTTAIPDLHFASNSDALYTAMAGDSFLSGQAKTSAIIENILREGADNATRGTTAIHAATYAVIDSGTTGTLTVVGDDNTPVQGGVSYSLAQLMEKIDLRWQKLTDSQQAQLKTLYQLDPEAMADWALYNMVADINGTASVRPLKILTLGHSLAVDSGHMLNLIANTEGYDQELVIGTLYYSGCALWRHVNYLTNDTPAYSLYLSSTAKPDKPPVILKDFTMKDAIVYDDWDIIIMQGGAFEIAEHKTYTNGDIQTIQNYVNQHKTNPDAIFAWHMPWVFPTVDELRNLYPYNPNTFVTNYEKYNDDRMVFYNAITDCVEQNIETDDSFVFVIPTGTAIENAMSSYMDEFDIYRDYSHVSDFGRVIATYTWYCRLVGIDHLEDIQLDAIPVAFLKSTSDKTQDRILTEAEKQIIIESVNNALANPYQVTPSQYTAEP